MTQKSGLPTKDEVREKLLRHIEVDAEFLKLQEEEIDPNARDYAIQVAGNWYVHAHVTENSKVAKYFPEELARESAELKTEFEGMVSESERAAYDSNPIVQRMKFPWFDNLDLSGNLRKQLTVDTMMEHNALTMMLGHDTGNRIEDTATRGVVSRVRSSDLYNRKKNLEERMMAHLDGS